MSFLNDKVPCKSCGDLFDPDLLEDGECSDCRSYDPRDHYDAWEDDN